MDDFVEIRLWGEQRLDVLRRFLPAHDTLNDVIDALDADPPAERQRLLARCVLQKEHSG